MQIKNDLRAEFRQKRARTENKSEKDRLICTGFLNSRLYKNAEEILCYFSTGSEIDTMQIINAVFKDGKRLYLPKCTDLNGNMDFYLVKSLDTLITGSYGITEPDPSLSSRAVCFHNAVCIVPALSFDRFGFRLGYGKGYYDRFLEKFTNISVGLCYNELMSDKLPAESYDQPVDYIFTQSEIISL